MTQAMPTQTRSYTQRNLGTDRENKFGNSYFQGCGLSLRSIASSSSDRSMARVTLPGIEKRARTSAASACRQIVVVSFIDPPASIDAAPLRVGSPPSDPPADPG